MPRIDQPAVEGEPIAVSFFSSGATLVDWVQSVAFRSAPRDEVI
jgi:hypothetical protein